MRLEKYLLLLFLILLAILFFIGWKYFKSCQMEGFDDLVPIEYVVDSNGKPTTQLIPGYYKADDLFMRKIPYGYVINPEDPMHILPKSQTALIYAAGQYRYGSENIIEDGYYLTTDNRLAILPPGMYANVNTVTYLRNSAGSVPILKYTYNEGYVSKERHLLKTFPVTSETIVELPPGFYYTDSKKTQISFLPEDAQANITEGWGYVYPEGKSPTSVNPANKSLTYSDISRNFMNYHKTEDEMRAEMGKDAEKLGGYMSITVRDKNGNLIRMPVPDLSYGLLGIDGEIYYNPGQYPYGSKNYIPSYTDYVYMTYADGVNKPQLTMSNYVNSDSSRGGFCENTKHSMIERESQCNSLSGNLCASTSCCVLLGGEKCVAGGEDGPSDKENYSDLFIKNKDFYYYNSKCYGNCPL